jgi:hypothetical protein
MTQWLIKLTAKTPADDSKILNVMRQAAKLGLTYTVSSKEVPIVTGRNSSGH